MSPASRRRPRGGFTIIELIVALVVTTMVLTIAYASLQVAGDARTRMRAERRIALSGAAARLTLDAWLRGATLAGGHAPYLGLHRRRPDAAAADEVSFAVLDAGPLRPGPHRIRLWVQSGVDPARIGLLAELAPVHAPPGVVAETILVAPRATGLAMRYRVGRGGREEWVREWRSDRELPGAVELRATGHGIDPLLAIPMRLTVGSEGW